MLTSGHLCWFKDKGKRDQESPCGIIDLHRVTEVNLLKIENDEHHPGLGSIDMISVHVEGDDGKTTIYFFGDFTKGFYNKEWKKQIDFAIEQIKKK